MVVSSNSVWYVIIIHNGKGMGEVEVKMSPGVQNLWKRCVRLFGSRTPNNHSSKSPAGFWELLARQFSARSGSCKTASACLFEGLPPYAVRHYAFFVVYFLLWAERISQKREREPEPTDFWSAAKPRAAKEFCLAGDRKAENAWRHKHYGPPRRKTP